MDAEALVFVVDDDASLRESLQDLLGSVGLRVAAFASAQEFLRRPRPEVPSCLVLDVRLPGLSGLELQQRMAEGDRDMPIIFITGHGDIPMTCAGDESRGRGVFDQAFPRPRLLDAIHQALARDRHAREQRAEMAALRRRFDTLTPRQRDVLARMVAGLLNKQIAGELGTSEATVKTHRKQVMAKMRPSPSPTSSESLISSASSPQSRSRLDQRMIDVRSRRRYSMLSRTIMCRRQARSAVALRRAGGFPAVPPTRRR